ncbi:putative rmlC-like jelly roll protein [Medicago truncatula]|uniref:Allergen gly M Bd 28 kDa protein n=2 Tax=Medicago truncatula TaxID=3880 RepID=Q2HSU3_MEDTR|nr:Cupin region [Medicago truncatula]AES67429.1 allergen gly M Bd 28 kDa protein [Medicago truncatula]RHN75897.1 putative rmlC-like jelly roll protein [Medicago truncatula]
MGNKAPLLIMLLILCHGVSMTMAMWEAEDKSNGPSTKDKKLFLLQNSKRVVKTDAGEMRVLESRGGRILERRLHVGFITMEPSSLFVPQYLDSTLIIFVLTGEAKVGFMYENELEESELKKGDVYQIPAGSAFYLSNIGEGQKLHIICSIDPSESLGIGIFQSFYIGGGAPVSVFSGFEPQILESAFNVSGSELSKFFTRKHEGPIVHVGHSHASASSIWTKFLQLKEDEKLHHMKKMIQDQEEDDVEEEVKQKTSWSWRKLLESVFGNEIENIKKDKVAHKSPRSCNLYDRKPDFKNSYGWSVALDGSDYSPLKSSGVGIYHVNLKPGSMMTPHVNPRATEYGIVIRGSGRIQIVFPNGTNAMDTHIKQGDVFFVPRYFAFFQIASSNEPLDFFGFTTSAQKNKPQFLVGATSLMKSMMGPELAAAFGVSEDSMQNILNAQQESVIVPTPWTAPGL